MLRKIQNIVKGNLYYWNTTHNVNAVSCIQGKFSNLSQIDRDIGIHILSSSTMIISAFLGPVRKDLTFNKVTDKQMRKLTVNQHHRMLMSCFEMFVQMFGLSKNYENVTEIYKSTFGDYTTTGLVFENDKAGLQKLIKVYSEEITITSGIINTNDTCYFYSFFTLATEHAKDLKNYIN